MKRLRIERTVFLFAVLLFWALVFSCSRAHAQGGGYVSNGRQETTPAGRYVSMWNATGTEIADGTVVMVDTVAAVTGPQIPLGKGFKTWTGASTANVYLIAGVLIGNCPSYSQGRVMVEGFHNNVLMDASAITAFARLRPSLTTAGALALYTATADSVNSIKPIVGVFQRYKDGTSLRGYVWVKFGPGLFRAD